MNYGKVGNILKQTKNKKVHKYIGSAYFNFYYFRFLRMQVLDNHIATHTTARKFSCDVSF
jgi:hypothetical protein